MVASQAIVLAQDYIPSLILAVDGTGQKYSFHGISGCLTAHRRRLCSEERMGVLHTHCYKVKLRLESEITLWRL